MTGPLSGIRVLEFSQVVAGPVVGLLLADFGADVVKVESPGGDSFRRTASVVPGTSKSFQWYNRGKRGIVLNLQRPEAQAVVHRIVPNFDVVLINYRPGVAERLHIDYPTLSKLRPDLVYAQITGFGPDGPMADMASSDIVSQAYSGVIADDRQLDEWGQPRRISALPVGDLMAGLSLAAGIGAALFHRALTGEGQLVETSLLQGAMGAIGRSVMREPVTDALFSDPAMELVRQRFEEGAGYAGAMEAYKAAGLNATGAVRRIYHAAYETKDGAVVVGALTKANRDAIRSVIGFPYEGGDDPGFDPLDPATRERIRGVKRQVIEIMKTRTTNEWMAGFRAAGAPAAPVRFPEQLHDDPQAARFMVELEDPLSGWQKQLGPLVGMSRTPTAPQGPAPPLGAHTEEVLRGEGFSETEITSLRESGALG
jgi:formyl-CoA transferase